MADHQTDDEEEHEEEQNITAMDGWSHKRVRASIAQVVRKLRQLLREGWPSFTLAKLSSCRGHHVASMNGTNWFSASHILRCLSRSIMQQALALNVSILRLPNENYIDRLTRIVDESNVASEAKDERYWRSLATERDADGIEEEDFGQSEAHWTGTLGQWKPRDGEDEVQQLERIV